MAATRVESRTFPTSRSEKPPGAQTSSSFRKASRSAACAPATPAPWPTGPLQWDTKTTHPATNTTSPVRIASSRPRAVMRDLPSGSVSANHRQPRSTSRPSGFSRSDTHGRRCQGPRTEGCGQSAAPVSTLGYAPPPGDPAPDRAGSGWAPDPGRAGWCLEGAQEGGVLEQDAEVGEELGGVGA